MPPEVQECQRVRRARRDGLRSCSERLLIGHATDLELDGNGRILLPPLLRDYASLVKGLVLVGQGNKIEIWADELWSASMEVWLSDSTADLLADGDEFTGLSV